MTHASRVEAVLFAALEKPTTAERNAFLDSACAGDAELRRQVVKLLQAHANVGDFLQKPVGEQLAAAAEPADATQEIAATDGPGAGPAGRTGLFLARTEGAGASDEDSALDFLQPSTRPAALGRLGHYEVLEVLGRGGFGIVFRAFDESLQRVVAIKVLAPEMAATSPARKRFVREARASAMVQHDNIVQVFAVEEEPLPHLVMEFVPGETLQQRLDRNGPLEVAEVVRLGRQIAEGLGAAHDKGLIHRDVKPANILIEVPSPPTSLPQGERGEKTVPTPRPRGERGACGHVKITDFGLARAADDASMSQSGMIAGTPMYMAPEQASADELDHRADLFSLGSVLYTMCSGRPPFRAPSTLAVLKRVAEDTPRPIREIIPEVPQWLCDLIARLHAKKPEDRIATAREVADLLDRGLAEPRIEDRRSKIEDRKETPDPRSSILDPRSSILRIRRWAAAAAMLLVLLGGLGITEATGLTNVRGTVIRLFSPEGTLVVEVDDPGVSVKIDGSEIVITGAGAKEIRLKPGRYLVEASKDGKLVSRELVTVTNNGRQVVRVRQEPATVAEKTDSDRRVSQEPVPVAEKTDPDRRAAEYVLSLGGTVRTNGEDRNVQAVAELPRTPFRLLLIILRDNPAVTDDGLAAFEGCQHLKEVYLWGSKNVSDSGLRHFCQCKELRVLGIGGTAVTDSGLALLRDLRTLEYLHVSSMPVTAEGLSNLRDCKNLKILNLHWCKTFTDKDVPILLDWPALSELILDGTGVTDAGVAQLAALKKLRSLRLRKTQVTMTGVEKLAKVLPGCKIEWDGGVLEPK